MKAQFVEKDDFVIKIFNEKVDIATKIKKIDLLRKSQITDRSICVPCFVVYDGNNSPVGYMMRKVPDAAVRLDKLMCAKHILKSHFPDWKKRDLVELCIIILNKINYLHSKNILIGDVNPANILVESSTSVYFVDTDSYQIDDFPSTVGTKEFTPPNLFGRKFASVIRSLSDENYSIATLLFYIMVNGMNPYIRTGVVDIDEAIANPEFTYPFGKFKRNPPDQQAMNIWSHLPFDLKACFHNTFDTKGKYYLDKNNLPSDHTRLTVDEWLGEFEKYLKNLDGGMMGSNDKMSEEIFPSRKKESQTGGRK